MTCLKRSLYLVYIYIYSVRTMATAGQTMTEKCSYAAGCGA